MIPMQATYSALLMFVNFDEFDAKHIVFNCRSLFIFLVSIPTSMFPKIVFVKVDGFDAETIVILIVVYATFDVFHDKTFVFNHLL